MKYKVVTALLSITICMTAMTARSYAAEVPKDEAFAVNVDAAAGDDGAVPETEETEGAPGPEGEGCIEDIADAAPAEEEKTVEETAGTDMQAAEEGENTTEPSGEESGDGADKAADDADEDDQKIQEAEDADAEAESPEEHVTDNEQEPATDTEQEDYSGDGQENGETVSDDIEENTAEDMEKPAGSIEAGEVETDKDTEKTEETGKEEEEKDGIKEDQAQPETAAADAAAAADPAAKEAAGENIEIQTKEVKDIKAAEPADAVTTGIKQMTLEVIDYLGDGFGDSQMLVSNGKKLLIDTYVSSSWDTLRSWLLDRKYTNFDIYISHYHDDHIGNVRNLVEDGAFNISKLYLPDFSYMTGTSSYMKNYISMCNGMINSAKSKGVAIQYLKKGSSFNIGDVAANVLWGATYKSDTHDTHYINNNSLVTRFTCGNTRYLNAGDIESETEKEILNAKVDVSADIFKLSHHGGNSSNTDAFLKAVNAAYYYYNYCEDSPSKYSPSGSWSYAPTQNAKKYGNVASVRYNGNIVYNVYDDVISQELDRNYNEKTVYLYDKTDTKKLKGVITLQTNSASTQKIDARSFDKYGYSTTKRSGTYAPDGWIMGNGGLQYYYKNNAPVKGWLTADGNRYYFNTSGIKETGWNDIGSDTYYFDGSGVMQTGFVKIGAATHYFDENGKQAKTGWKLIGGKWYYFGAYNKLMFGKQTIDGKTYILNKTTGAMCTGVVTYNGDLLFCDKSGVLKTSGWQTYDNKKYYVDPELGTVVTGWEDIGSDTYYFDTKGVMQTGFVKVGTATHYFDENGRQYKTGWKTINDKKYYFGEYNKLMFGLQTIGGKTYTLDETTGELRTGIVTIGGAEYFSNTSGILQTGWQTLGGKKYYADPSTKKITTGFKKIDGSTYYFDASGAMQTGFVKIGGDTYYFDKNGKRAENGIPMIGTKRYGFDENGRMLYGFKTINGKTYYFYPETGAAASALATIDGNRYYFDQDDNYMQKGEIMIEKNRLYYFHPETGILQTGFYERDGGTAYSDPETGWVAVGWKEIDGATYYFYPRAMLTGPSAVNGKAYCFDKDGKLLKNGWKKVGSEWYLTDKNGACRTGWSKIGVKQFYFDETGMRKHGISVIDGKKYVFNNSGVLVTDSRITLNGKTYRADENGVMMTGVVQEEDGRYCYDASGVLRKAPFREGGKTYCVDSTGKIPGEGWQTVNGSRYYINSDGTCMTAWQKIDRKWYFFSVLGVNSSGIQTINGKKYVFREDGSMAVNAIVRYSDGSVYCGDVKGNMSVNAWKTIGKKTYYFGADGKAVKGTVTIDGKQYRFAEDGSLIS